MKVRKTDTEVCKKEINGEVDGLNGGAVHAHIG